MNAFLPIEVTEAGMVTEARAEQPSKAPSATVETPLGITTEVTAVPANAAAPIVSSAEPLANVTVERVAHPAKAPAPMLVTEAGMVTEVI